MKAFVAMCFAVAMAACSASGASGPDAALSPHLTFDQLRNRPLHVSSIAPGAACPTSKLSTIKLGSSSVLANGTWPFSFGPYGWPIGSGDFSKTPWSVADGYTGRIVVRGQRLDGPGRIAFGFWPIGYGTPAASSDLPILFTRLDTMKRTVVYQAELDLEAPAGGHADGHYWSFPSVGCYVLQADGDSFTNVTVVHVTQS